MTTIVLADDHEVVRQGLRALLEAEEDFSVIGEAADGLEALELVERLAPDVLVLDLMMPGLNGLEVARRVAKLSAKSRVVILTMHSSEAYVLEALKSGASAFVLKNVGLPELARAVREAASGRRYLSPPFSQERIDRYLSKVKGRIPDRYEKLTNREREVLQLAAEGLTNPEIGHRLFVSPRTVDDHRASVFRKLGLKGQTELVRYALKRGIIRLDS